jgi:hypothetical protein
MSLPNGNQIKRTSTLRMCSREQRFIGRAHVGRGGESGDHHQHGDEPAEVIVEIGQHAHHGVGHPPEQHRQEQGQGQHRNDGDQAARQARPGDTEQAAEKQDVRPEQQHQRQTAEVIAIAESLAGAGAPDEFPVRPGARADGDQAAGQEFEH